MTHELYTLYRRCFPHYPVTEADFADILAPEEGQILRRTADGQLIACAVVHGDSIALLCVDPAHRGRGIGSGLLHEAEELIRAAGHSHVTLGLGDHYLFQGAPADSEDTVHFFSRRGYAAEWTSVNMRMRITDFCADKLALPPSPPEIVYRTAEAADMPSLLQAVRETDEDWAEYFSEDEPIMTAVCGGRVVGFAILSVGGARFADGDPQAGSIGCVGVIPSMRERGIGRQIVVKSVEWLQERGCTSAELLYVELVSWYGRIGFDVCSRQWMGEKDL